MAKTKSDLLADAKAAGVVAADVDDDAYTIEELRSLLSGEEKADRTMATEPIIAADGHVVLSKEDIRARDQ